MPNADDPAVRAAQLLRACLDRASERVKLITPQAVRDSGAEEEGRLRFTAAYNRAWLISMGAGALGCFASLRISRRPFLSALAGSSFGLTCAAMDMVGHMPRLLLEVAQSPEPSGVADKFICPVVGEFEPCMMPGREGF